MPNEVILELFMKRYLDKGNFEEVNYFDFCKDVDIPDEPFHPRHQNPEPVNLKNIFEKMA